jgi:hypothetical protein
MSETGRLAPFGWIKTRAGEMVSRTPAENLSSKRVLARLRERCREPSHPWNRVTRCASFAVVALLLWGRKHERLA